MFYCFVFVCVAFFVVVFALPLYDFHDVSVLRRVVPEKKKNRKKGVYGFRWVDGRV